MIEQLLPEVSSCVSWNNRAPTREDLVSYIRTNWSRDPFAFGAYSYVANGSRQSDRAMIAEPIESRVFFAGEAVHPKYNGTVHAAYETGVDVAKRVREREPKCVAVIGAGISGLAAAHVLANQSTRVTVLEARDRIGGRIRTDRGLGAAVDVGATWIHGPEGNPIKKLADELGQATIETMDEGIARGKEGQVLSEKDVPSWLKKLNDYLSSGADPDQLNMLHYGLDYIFRGANVGYPGPDVKFPEGYDRIFAGFKGDYSVKLSSSVQRVSIVEGGVEVATHDQETGDVFDAVILTVPLGVLKRGHIAFDPPLSRDKQGAIARLGMGTLDKLYLRFEGAFWDEEATWIYTPENGLPQGQFNVWVNFHRYLGVPILLGFNSGTTALDLASHTDQEVVSRALRTLAMAYPAT